MSAPRPPAAGDGVFNVHKTTEINAPIEEVWRVLTDFPKYHDWNPFVRSITIVDKSKKELADQTLAVDKFLLMKCNIPPSMDDNRKQAHSLELVKAVDEENHRLSWIYVDYPSWVLRAERWQILTSLPDGRTKYETWEVFGGSLAYVVKWHLGKSLEESFTSFATGLKDYCERR